MKKTISILLSCLLAYPVLAQPAAPPRPVYPTDHVLRPDSHADSLLVIVGEFMVPVIFDINRYDLKPTPLLDEAVDSIGRQRHNLTCIWIEGSASPEGPQRWNQRLGAYRAEALSDYLIRRTRLDSRLFRTTNRGEDWEALARTLENAPDFPNRARILTILSEEPDSEARKRRIRAIDGGETWRRLLREVFPPLRNARLALVTTLPKVQPIAPQLAAPPTVIEASLLQRLPERMPDKCTHWRLAVKTNLLFDAALVANLGVEVSPWPHWSLDIPVWYSPYSITPTRKLRLLAVQPEIRWWPDEAMNGHFIGLHAHVAGFNIAINDKGRYQDPNRALWGVGVSYGYALPLDRKAHWGLEFHIGAGFASYRYDAYRNWTNGPKFQSGEGTYWGITSAGITLSYTWDLSHKHRKD